MGRFPTELKESYSAANEMVDRSYSPAPIRPTLPANLAKRLAGPLGLTAFETPIALPRIEITQYWHERYHRDPAHRWFRSVTSELFGATASMRGRTTASN